MLPVITPLLLITVQLPALAQQVQAETAAAGATEADLARAARDSPETD